MLTGSRSFDCLPSSCLHESTVTSISGPIVAIAMIRSGLESEDGAEGHRIASFRAIGSLQTCKGKAFDRIEVT